MRLLNLEDLDPFGEEFLATRRILPETAAAAVLLDIDEDPKLEVTNSIDAVAHSSGAGAARHTTQRWQHLNAVRQSIWSNDMRSEQV